MASLREFVYTTDNALAALSTSLIDSYAKIQNTMYPKVDSDPKILRVVEVNDDISAESLLSLTLDLLENDRRINNEKTAFNAIINEGVFKDYSGGSFDVTCDMSNTSTTPLQLTLSAGKIKANNISSDGGNVYTITDPKTFVLPSASGLYRRDLISIVISDNNSAT